MKIAVCNFFHRCTSFFLMYHYRLLVNWNIRKSITNKLYNIQSEIDSILNWYFFCFHAMPHWFLQKIFTICILIQFKVIFCRDDKLKRYYILLIRVLYIVNRAGYYIPIPNHRIFRYFSIFFKIHLRFY